MTSYPVIAAFVGNDAWFGVLLGLHVAGAIIGLGPTFAFGVLGAVAKRQENPMGALAILEATHATEAKLVSPILNILQPLTGVLLIWNRGLNENFFSGRNAWLIAAILVYIAGTGIANGIQTPAMVKMLAMARSGKAGDPKFEALGKRLNTFGPILTLVGVTLIVLMVWKPGSGCGPLYRC